MKRQAYLRDENLLTLLSLHDFIIPEIQREYVWGSKDNSERILKPFLESIKSGAHVDEHCHYAHGLENVHMGFLYSYKPQYIKDITDRITDEYLIDGQQRFTSLFLLLFVRAVRENRLVDFNNLIRWEDGNIAFDYKVRQLTHQFVKDLVCHVQNGGNQVLNDVVEGNYPCWLMDDYLQDTTISNMIGALKCISAVFGNDEDLYYDYLLTRIHFWHFKTDVTSQGEELYITMNSRGEELSDNEVQKARKLKVANQLEWGPRWEEWQTFFWRNRTKGGAKNVDADKGFNNLLFCVEAMAERLKKDYSHINDIETAVEALRFIVDTDWATLLKNMSASYYTEWIVTFKNDVWTRINTTTAKWKIDTESDTVQRENAVLLWPLLYYFFGHKNIPIDDISFIRLMHLCYLNYHSKKTNYASIKDFVDELCDTGSNLLSLKNESFLSDENWLLADVIGKAQWPEKLESIIWQIQDKPYFLDGEDVGGETIGAYVRLMQNNGVDLYSGLANLYDNYEVLFPTINGKKNEILLKRILLYYKGGDNETFWKRTSPYYNRNYETSLWKRIIRDETFLKFYEEITDRFTKVIVQNDLDIFIARKQKIFFGEPNNRDFTSRKWSDRRIAILLDTVTGGDLWNENRHVDLGFSDIVDSNGKPFIGNTRVGNRVCGKRYKWNWISLPSHWEWYLQRKYPYYSFIF